MYSLITTNDKTKQGGNMKTYTEFIAENEGCFFWHCDAGMIDGNECLDVLVYDSEEDMEADDDNSLVVNRATVIDDRGDTE
jgi:hypothetical protein